MSGMEISLSQSWPLGSFSTFELIGIAITPNMKIKLGGSRANIREGWGSGSGQSRSLA